MRKSHVARSSNNEKSFFTINGKQYVKPATWGDALKLAMRFKDSNNDDERLYFLDTLSNMAIVADRYARIVTTKA